jgi:hypothetical protein
MKRRLNADNRKLIKRNVPGTERAKREGPWRAKDTKLTEKRHNDN